MSRPRQRPPKLKERCSHEGCNARAKQKHECLTCEKLGKEVFTIAGCREHASWALTMVKRHALVKHPVNMLRVGAAALRGEDIE